MSDPLLQLGRIEAAPGIVPLVARASGPCQRGPSSWDAKRGNHYKKTGVSGLVRLAAAAKRNESRTEAVISVARRFLEESLSRECT